MANKKELILEEIRKCFKLMQSYSQSDIIPLKAISKELKVRPLDFWDFIQKHRAYFNLLISDNSKVGWLIKHVLDSPMTDTELESELSNNERRKAD